MIPGIPRERWLAALAHPANVHAQEALRRATGLSETLPILLSSQGVEGGAQGGREARQKGRRTEGLDSLRLTLYGPPRTKKNSAARLSNKGKPCIVPSAAWMKWRDACLKQVNDSMRLRDQPYNLSALFYRDAARGDLVGYIQALQDVLQEAQIISDDRWFASLDGSRLLIDRKNPRVEVDILAM